MIIYKNINVITFLLLTNYSSILYVKYYTSTRFDLYIKGTISD